MHNRPAIHPTIRSLRDHFSELVSQQPIRHPESLAFKTRFKGCYTSAAVLIPIVKSSQSLQVLLTERAFHLRHHPGQISFPGGRKEQQDTSFEATALRESHEEIGLRADQVQVLGHLGDYYTVSGFQVTPVVGLVDPAFQPQLEPGEVSRLLSVPMAFLMDPTNFKLRETVYNNELRHYYSAHYHDELIWGVTAGIIVALYESLLLSHRD